MAVKTCSQEAAAVADAEGVRVCVETLPAPASDVLEVAAEEVDCEDASTESSEGMGVVGVTRKKCKVSSVRLSSISGGTVEDFAASVMFIFDVSR